MLRGPGRVTALITALVIALVPGAITRAQEATPQDSFATDGFGVDIPELPGAVPPAADPPAIQVPSGGRPLILTRLEALPRQLQAAVERATCRLTDAMLATYPALIFRPADGRRLMAVVPCFAITPDSRAFLFDRAVDQEPSPMMFPVIALSGGFSASPQPGLMSWDAQSRTLTAWRGSETCPGRELRHTYRQGSGELNGFALSRVEHRRVRCVMPEVPWQQVWQSPAWNLPP